MLPLLILFLNATELTYSECPVSVAISVWDYTFQSFIVLSLDPLARIFPELLNATELTKLECPEEINLQRL